MMVPGFAATGGPDPGTLVIDLIRADNCRVLRFYSWKRGIPPEQVVCRITRGVVV